MKTVYRLKTPLTPPTQSSQPASEGRSESEPKIYGPFELSTKGVYHIGTEDKETGEKKRTYVCSWLEVSARTRDQNSKEWGHLLRWKDSDGLIHQWSVPTSHVQKKGTEVVEVLAAGGFNVAYGANGKVNQYILSVNPAKRITNVPRTGWHTLKGKDGKEQRVFALPNQILPDRSADEIVLQQDVYNAAGVSATGSLEDWKKNVASLCVGNDNLVFSVSVGFAAPTLELFGCDSGGFHFYGVSSSGKSTALNVAASVWGYPVQTWRTTDNALEDTAERHNDLLLPLDELSQVDAKKAADIAYMLGNGEGKQRLTQQIVAQKKKKWKLLFLSTGEITLSDHAEAGGKKTRAGTEVRMVNIDADAGAGMGVFTDLHGDTLPANFADRIKARSIEYRGTAGPAFVRYLIEHEAEALESLKRSKKEFTGRVRKDLGNGASGEIYRVTERFGLAAAAGELATEIGITGWPKGTAIEATAQCFKSWLDRRSTGSSDMEKAIAEIRRFLLANPNRFEELVASEKGGFIPADNEKPTPNRVGFLRRDENNIEYLIPADIFRSEMCKGYDVKKVAQELAKRGHLRRQADRFQVQYRIPSLSKKPMRFYAVQNSIFHDGEPGPETSNEPETAGIVASQKGGTEPC